MFAPGEITTLSVIFPPPLYQATHQSFPLQHQVLLILQVFWQRGSLKGCQRSIVLRWIGSTSMLVPYQSWLIPHLKPGFSYTKNHMIADTRSSEEVLSTIESTICECFWGHFVRRGAFPVRLGESVWTSSKTGSTVIELWLVLSLHQYPWELKQRGAESQYAEVGQESEWCIPSD